METGREDFIYDYSSEFFLSLLDADFLELVLNLDSSDESKMKCELFVEKLEVDLSTAEYINTLRYLIKSLAKVKVARNQDGIDLLNLFLREKLGELVTVDDCHKSVKNNRNIALETLDMIDKLERISIYYHYFEVRLNNFIDSNECFESMYQSLQYFGALIKDVIERSDCKYDIALLQDLLDRVDAYMILLVTRNSINSRLASSSLN